MKESKFDEPVTVCIETKYEALVQEVPNVDKIVEEHPCERQQWLVLKRENNTVKMLLSSSVVRWWTKQPNAPL